MRFESNVDWEYRRRVILEVQAEGGTASVAAERLGIKTNTMHRASRQLGIPFPPRSDIRPEPDWEGRKKVILDVQASGGTAKDAAERLGLKTDTILKTARKLGVRFPSNNGYHGNHKRAKPLPSKTKDASGDKMRDINNICWSAYQRRRRFAKAMEAAPPQPLTDAELIARAIAEGKVTRLPSGAAIGGPSWITGDASHCVKPRSVIRGRSRLGAGWNA